MRIDIITLFPEMFEGPLGVSILGRAQKDKLIKIKIHDLRRFTSDKHGKVDDKPFGGGAGLVLKVEPIFKALKAIRKTNKGKVIFMGPKGKVLVQSKLKKLSKEKDLIILCGHYDEIDERVRKHLIDEEISIGEYILTGGEIPAMVLVDGVSRLIKGVVGKEASLQNETYSRKGVVKHPQYTQPREFNGWKVPEVLISGHHGEIEKWRKKHSKF